MPGPLASTYYSQRASAGLIVSEATQISAMGKGYINTPGIHSEEQIAGWKPVVDAVHRSGGRMFLQLWHVGRISHSSLLPGGASPVAPSAIRARAQTVIETGFVDVSEPRALSLTEIQAHDRGLWPRCFQCQGRWLRWRGDSRCQRLPD